MVVFVVIIFFKKIGLKNTSCNLKKKKVGLKEYLFSNYCCEKDFCM